MKLHTDSKLFKEAIKATAQLFNIKEIYVEKDYWVTLALSIIFNSDLKDDVVFKGGTALSKCYKLISRFSEDIDLVVLQKGDETDSQLKSKIRSISKVVEEDIPEVKKEGITNKRGNIRKTAHEYPKTLEDDFGQARDFIVLETSSLGNHEPFINKNVSSLIYEMMEQNGQAEVVKTYNLAPFEVKVLDKTRTFCEKVMSLVRFSHSENPIEDLRLKIRHIYDLNQMLQDDEVKKFFDSTQFGEMLNKVGRDDISSYRNNNKWVSKHPKEAIIFEKHGEVWTKLKETYANSFADLVFENLPEEADILKTLYSINEALKEITWSPNTSEDLQ